MKQIVVTVRNAQLNSAELFREIGALVLKNIIADSDLVPVVEVNLKDGAEKELHGTSQPASS